MTAPIKIEYELVDLEEEKYTEKLESFIELHEDYLHWRIRFYADIPIMEGDLKCGFENTFRCCERYKKRSSIQEVTKRYLNDTKLWKVDIGCMGEDESIFMIFKRESQATEMAEKLVAYMLGK